MSQLRIFGEVIRANKFNPDTPFRFSQHDKRTVAKKNRDARKAIAITNAAWKAITDELSNSDLIIHENTND